MGSNSGTEPPADRTNSDGGGDDNLISSLQSLHRAVYSRRSEYVRPHRIRVKVGSWNVAACPGTDKDLASWFVSGKGIDRRLATLDISRNPAIEREETADSLDDDPNAVRLVGGDKIGLYVLGLQEVEDLNVATQYVTRVVYADAGLSATDRWKMALETALPPGYVSVASEQLSGLLLLIYAAPDVASSIDNVSTCSVGTGFGTGLLGYLGNKGAVSARIVLGETTRMSFVNCHLASGHDAAYLERRVWDVGQILSRTQFKPVSHHAAPLEGSEPEKIGDEDFVFWFGDLNFRLDGLPGDDIRRLLMLHTRGEYDISKKLGTGESLDGEDAIVLRRSSSDTGSTSTDEEEGDNRGGGEGKGNRLQQASSASASDPSSGAADVDDSTVPLPDPDEFLPDPSDDPTSLQATLDSLLPHDQLRRLMKEGKVFHEGWREGPITFLPSYKYDVGTVGLFDTSDKKRAPSWCDRILYRTRRDKDEHDRKVKDANDARKRDEEMKSRGIDQAADEDDDILFDYDPDNDGDEQQPSRIAPAPLFNYDEYDEEADDGGGEPQDVTTKDGLNDRIHLNIYAAHQRIQSSDHKPIISVFTLDYDATVPELKAKVHSEVARELDRAENEGRPAITIVVERMDREKESFAAAASFASYASSASSFGSNAAMRSAHTHGHDTSEGEAVDFGQVSYLRKKTASMTIANTGRVSATFSFVEKPTTEDHSGSTGGKEGSLMPQWLTTSFVRTDLGEQVGEGESVGLGREVTLEPGDTVKALVDILVDDVGQVTKLNHGQASLDEVLVLRVEQGRDHFIPLRAAWVPTCVGRSVEELIRVPDGGIRAFISSLSERGAKSKRAGSVGSIPYDLEVRCAAPKELFKLTEAVETLTERVLADEQMLESCKLPRDSPGWPFVERADPRPVLTAAVIDMLDRDKLIANAFDPETPSAERLEAVTEALVLFLRGLTDGIITIPLWSRIEQEPLPSLAARGSGSGVLLSHRQDEDDKTAILDILASAPNHNIAFVFLMTTLAKVLAELSPLSKANVEALRASSLPWASSPSSSSGRSPVAVVARRSLSFRRSGPTGAGGVATADALAALEKRHAKERRFAEILAKAGVCRAPVATAVKDKERKAAEDKQRALLELFLRRSREELLL